MTALCVFVILALVGTALAWWCAGRRTDLPGLLTALGLGPGIGFALASVAFVGLRLCALNPGPVPVGGVGLVLAAILFWVGRRQRAPRETHARGCSTLAALGLALFAVALVAGSFAFYKRATWLQDGNWDAMAIWNLNARVYARATDVGATLAVMPGEHHPDYPFFLPGTLAAQWSLSGGEQLLTGQFASAALGAGLVLLVLVGVWQLGSLSLALFAAAAVAAIPHLMATAQSQYADTPLAYFLVATLLALARELTRPDSRAPMLCGFLVAMLPATKNEGAALALLCVLAFLFTAWTTRRVAPLGRSWFARFAAGAFLPLIVLGLQKTLWVAENDFTRDVGENLKTYLTDPLRHETVANAFLEQFSWSARDRWAGIWIALGIALIFCVHWRRVFASPRLRFLFLTTLGALIGWYAVYIVTPRDLAWHLSTSLDRLLAQILPACIVFTACASFHTESDSGEKKPSTLGQAQS